MKDVRPGLATPPAAHAPVDNATSNTRGAPYPMWFEQAWHCFSLQESLLCAGARWRATVLRFLPAFGLIF
jgi:hypothetical protein